MDEFEQSDLEKQTDDSNNTIYKNAIHSTRVDRYVHFSGPISVYEIH